MIQNPALQSPLAISREKEPLDRDFIATHPKFPEAEAHVARQLIEMQEKTPRLTRLKSSHRKWMITHALFALSSERLPSDPLSGLTASRLIDTVIDIGAASRNTASAFLQEMLAYKFLREIPDVPDRRVRVLEPTDISIAGMKRWFDSHIEALDLLDGGNRMATYATMPEIFRAAHKRAASRLLEAPDWREPRPTISHFLWAEAGGMILHDLITRLPAAQFKDDRIWLGPLALSDLAEKYAVSVSNVKRMFSHTEKQGLAGWAEPRRRGSFWLSHIILQDYFFWQSNKFAALDEAFHWAAREQRQP